jgi:hypothetical protein
MPMRIEDLDEFEGLTADMVRDWLRAKGFVLHEVRSGRQCWVRGTEAVADDALTTSGTLIYLASVVAECSPQSLLREINPRMRPGWPTEGEIEHHNKSGGLWIAQGGDAALQFGRVGTKDGRRAFLDDAHETWWFADECGRWSFWPCDSHGNKVRRGTVG